MKSDFLIALTQLAAERHLQKEQVLQAIEAALASAFKKDNVGSGYNVSVKLNPNTGDIRVYNLKTVVETVEDPRKEMTLAEAKAVKASAALGETVELETLPHQASRIAAQTAKQVVLQRLREAERELVFQEFSGHAEGIISGVVAKIEAGRLVILDLGRAEAVLTPEEQVPTERYRPGQRLKVYVLEVKRTPKGPEIVVSRSHKDLIKRLFELEVPEVHNGVVELKSVAREPGSRSKVAVFARQAGVDPVGSCIGMRGNRIQNIVNELQGEKIDVVRWDKDLKRFISNALSPSEVVHVETNEREKSAVVVVPERQVSLAIGREGQNARLAAKLTGWHLDIKSMAEWELFKTQQSRAEEQAPGAVVAAEKGVPVAAAIAEPPVAAPVVEKAKEPVPVAQKAVAATQSIEEALAELLAQEAKGAPTPAVVQERPALAPEEEALSTSADGEELEVEGEGAPEPLGDEIWKMPVLTADAGKIRFAEDIMGDFRGRGRTDRRGRRDDDRSSGKKGARKKTKTKSASEGEAPS